MLTTLRIRNLALVADLTIEFDRGLTVITGETGAGKSVILGALNLVLGQRADRTLLRSGADACTVEAVFDVTGLRTPLAAFLVENGLESGDPGQLILKRTFTASGTNRQFVNGSPTTLDRLAVLGQRLTQAVTLRKRWWICMVRMSTSPCFSPRDNWPFWMRLDGSPSG